MLDNKMKELKETRAIKDTDFNERGLFFEDKFSGGSDESEMDILMEKHPKYRSRNIQLMHEL